MKLSCLLVDIGNVIYALVSSRCDDYESLYSVTRHLESLQLVQETDEASV